MFLSDFSINRRVSESKYTSFVPHEILSTLTNKRVKGCLTQTESVVWQMSHGGTKPVLWDLFTSRDTLVSYIFVQELFGAVGKYRPLWIQGKLRRLD